MELLLLQVRRHQDDAFRLEVAKAIVEAKVRHQQRLLRRHARNHPDPVLSQAADQLGLCAKAVARCNSVAEAMGVEGQASAIYFSAFGRCIRQEGIKFESRNRRPPKDPVNAVLSLGYMLVLGEVITAILAQGLQAGIGFLHEVSRRRPALAMDLLEPVRQPIVDRLTLSLFNRKVLTLEDFSPQDDGVLLGQEGLKRYLYFYERAMTARFRLGPEGRAGTFRDLLLRDAEGLKRALRERSRWKPTLLEL